MDNVIVYWQVLLQCKATNTFLWYLKTTMLLSHVCIAIVRTYQSCRILHFVQHSIELTYDKRQTVYLHKKETHVSLAL